VVGKGSNDTKKAAMRACWVDFVRQLYESGTAAEALAKRPSVIELSDEESRSEARFPIIPGAWWLPQC